MFLIRRDSSELVASDDMDHPSLPSHHIPSCPTRRALYSTVHCTVDTSRLDLLNGDDVALRCTNLVHGFVRLSLACVRLHKGLMERVATAIFTCPAFYQILGGCLSRRGEVYLKMDVLVNFLLVVNFFFGYQVLLTSYIKSGLIHTSVKIFVMWVSILLCI